MNAATLHTAEAKYLLPGSLREAADMAAEHQDHFRFVAGGTDVLVNRFQGNEASACLIDLGRIPDLQGIARADGHLRIGALETLDRLQGDPLVLAEAPMLAEAARSVGAPLLRKAATLGGNVLCENRCLYYNQSEWWRESVGYCLKCNGDICIATGGRNACFSELVSDTAPALIALDAEIEYADGEAVVRRKLESIYTGDGVAPRNLPPAAIVTALWLPLGRGFTWAFHKLRERQSLEFTSLTTAMTLDSGGRIKVAMAGVDPRPVVVEAAATDDPEAVVRKAIKGARAIDNDMFTRLYRREMIGVYLRESFNTVTAART